MKSFVAIISLVLLLPTKCAHCTEPGLSELEQQALQSATQRVEDSVVQIRTVGGLDRVGKTMLSQGPTTGLIISSDGYIVSSAYNFAGQPSSILVRLADGKQLAAELIARDKNRMLVLLKVSAERLLPVPEPVFLAEIQVGQWAVAVGRTFRSERVGVSVGIVSAANRMYGRVIQTDANISVANYGGPLVDIAGRVIGILVPMSPQPSANKTASELAGAEFYDSGIGFAVPLEHVLGILERWKQGDDLLPGKLGIGLASGDAHITPPKIVSVWPNSPAAKAEWQANDLIKAVNGNPVETQSQLRFEITPSYAGDTLSVTLQRGDEQVETSVELTGELAPYRHAFLGVLPERSANNENQPGKSVSQVWPDSPAEKAGLLKGDRILSIGESKINSTADALTTMAGLQQGSTEELAILRGEEKITLTATLSAVPEEILKVDRLPTSTKKQDGNEGANESQLEKIMIPEFSQEAVYFSPASNRDTQQGLLVWLGDGEPARDQELLDVWQADCRRDGVILLIASPEETNTWAASDLAYLKQLARVATRRLNVDPHRIVIAGQGKAGQLAFALALKNRSTFAGVVGIDAPLPRTLSPPDTSPSNRLAILAIESRNSNFAPLIRRDIKSLRNAGYPTTWLERPETSDLKKPIDEATRASMGRWIAGLDRF